LLGPSRKSAKATDRADQQLKKSIAFRKSLDQCIADIDDIEAEVFHAVLVECSN
jgi:hypothetical protein